MENELVISDSTNDVKSGTEIKIDYLSLTFEFRCYDNDIELEKVDEVVQIVSNILGVPEEEIIEADYGKGNFRYLYHLGEGTDLKICGPINKLGNRTCSLQMKGTGCRVFERNNPDKTWQELLLDLGTGFEANCTRIDIAVDDYDGKLVPFDWVMDKLKRKMYTSAFVNPPTFITNEKDGSSISFGGRKSTQMLVIYEKDKEQRSKGYECNQEYWTRFEMRFQHEKANLIFNDVIYAMMGKIRYPEEREIPKGYDGFKIYTSSLLYKLLDIKVENEYDASNKGKAATEPNWLKFVNDIQKAKIPSVSRGNPKWLKYNKYINQTLPSYLLIMYVLANENPSQFSKDLIKTLYSGIDSILDDKRKLKKVNSHLKELEQISLDNSSVYKIKDELAKYLLEEELPF